MPDRPRMVIPGDVTSRFATFEELTGDALHLATLMRTARSRLIIATTSPDTSQCHQAFIWMQPGTCVVTRTATAPTGDIETHIYQIDNEEIPHVVAAMSPLAPTPAVFDGPASLPTAIVYAAQQGSVDQAAPTIPRSPHLSSPSGGPTPRGSERTAQMRIPSFQQASCRPSSLQPPPTGSRPHCSRPAPDLTSPSSPSTTRSCGA